MNNCKCSFHRDEKWQKCDKAAMDRWNVLCLGLFMHTWCAVIITSLDHFLILTIHGTLLILYRQQDYRYSDKYKGHYCYKLFCSWQMCHLKNYSSGTHLWIVSSMPNWQECTILKACRLCFHVFIPFDDNSAFSDTIRFRDDCATCLPITCTFSFLLKLFQKLFEFMYL